MRATYDEALARVLAAAEPLARVERLPLAGVRGRVLAQALPFPFDQPEGDTSRMDGYALRALDVPAAGTVLPVRLRVAAGQAPGELAPGAVARIFTGALLPAGADAVVPQEDVVAGNDGVRFGATVHPGQWVRAAGSEIRAGTEVLAAGEVLDAAQIALAASAGCTHLDVRARPVVSLLCTGSELVEPGLPRARGQIFDSNRAMVRSLLEGLGCEVREHPTIGDDRETTRSTLARAVQGADLLVTTGGVSVGEEDHVRGVMEQDGRVDLWQLALKPGKPLLFGSLQGCPVMGLPGNPVSSFITFVLLVRPFLLRRMGARKLAPVAQVLPAAFERDASEPRREFLRARLGPDGRVLLHPDQGPACLPSLHWADGLVDAPASTRIGEGEPVRFIPLRELLGLPA